MADGHHTGTDSGSTLRKAKSHCKRGHEMTPENTGVNRRGVRFCIECDRARKIKHRESRKAACGNLVEVPCPVCGVIRQVTVLTAERYRKVPHACKSCSRKEVRGRMRFAPRDCAKCGKSFSTFSGATRFCAECVKRTEPTPRPCPVCGRKFVGYKSRKTCSTSCNRRLRVNDSYFGGNLFKAEGWVSKTCQICGKTKLKKGASVHHVFGHPNHTALVVLCLGCHNAVSKLAGRTNLDAEMAKRIVWYAMAQKLGAEPAGIEKPKRVAAGDEQPRTEIELS